MQSLLLPSRTLYLALLASLDIFFQISNGILMEIEEVKEEVKEIIKKKNFRLCNSALHNEIKCKLCAPGRYISKYENLTNVVKK